MDNMKVDVEKTAKYLTSKYFHESMMGVMGAKIVGSNMYVIGGDNGFPHTRAHVKVDLTTGEIVEHYHAHDCPVYVAEGVYA